MIKEYKHDKVTTFPYGTNVFKVCENEMLSKINGVLIKLWYQSDYIYNKKYQSDNTNKIIVSQDFGENKYSKNIKGLSEISTAKISRAWVVSELQFC